jgi:hypothetical protein
MARNKVMKLWTAVVNAFLALCTALGFTTRTAAAAVPQTQPARNTGTPVAHVPLPGPRANGSWTRVRSLPPTMKQRIRAEAHGASPTCRDRLPADTTAADLFAPFLLRTVPEPARAIEPPVRLRR